MILLATYVGLVVVGDFGAFLIGRVVEHWSDTVGLAVFLACFVSVFVIAWKVAVRITEPKATHP